jgi:hypothetical protein
MLLSAYGDPEFWMKYKSLCRIRKTGNIMQVDPTKTNNPNIFFITIDKI